MLAKWHQERFTPQNTILGITGDVKASEVVAKLEKAGMKVNRVSDFKPFRASVESVYEQFKGSIGADLMQEATAAKM
jgi:predicted Zn-dependent peptidase